MVYCIMFFSSVTFYPKCPDWNTVKFYHVLAYRDIIGLHTEYYLKIVISIAKYNDDNDMLAIETK